MTEPQNALQFNRSSLSGAAAPAQIGDILAERRQPHRDGDLGNFCVLWTKAMSGDDEVFDPFFGLRRF